MGILATILIGLGTSLLGFAIGWLWRRFIDALRYRGARNFWSAFGTADLQVVVGRFLEFRSFEPSGFLGVGDAIAVAELRSYFDKLRLGRFALSYADRLSGDSLRTNLILLGGPDANLVTAEAVRRIDSTIKFADPARHVVDIYDSELSSVYRPSIEEGNGIDFGVIFKVRNPFALDKHMLIVAGSFGYGTWAAIRFVTSKDFLEHPLVRAKEQIECLVEADVVRGSPQNVKLCLLRKLTQQVQVDQETDIQKLAERW